MAHISNFGVHLLDGNAPPFPQNTSGTLTSEAVVITDTVSEGQEEFFTIEYVVNGQVVQSKQTSVPYPGDSVNLSATITTPSSGSMEICARVV